MKISCIVLQKDGLNILVRNMLSPYDVAGKRDCGGWANGLLRKIGWTLSILLHCFCVRYFMYHSFKYESMKRKHRIPIQPAG
jgi:hypothetical protein